MRVRRPAMCVAAAAVTLVLGAASYAFACSATAYMEPLSPNAGPRGSEVAVTGTSWATSSSSSTGSDATVGPVEIRWGNENGPVLGTANGPEFSVKVLIPDAAPGYYLITGVARDSNGGVVGRQSRTFRLIATAPAATTTPTAGSTSPTGGTTAPTADPVGQASSPTATEDPATAPAPAGSAGTATTEQSPAPPAPPASVATSSPAGASTPAASASPASSSPATAAIARRTPISAAVAVGAATPAPGSPGLPAATPPPVLVAAEATAAQVAPLADPSTLWDAVGTDAPARARPSLISDVPPGATRTSPALGIALLGIGMVSLSVAGLFVAVSRRRASAHSGRR